MCSPRSKPYPEFVSSSMMSNEPCRHDVDYAHMRFFLRGHLEYTQTVKQLQNRRSATECLHSVAILQKIVKIAKIMKIQYVNQFYVTFKQS